VVELKLEDWDDNIDRLSDESLRLLLAKLEEKLAIAEAAALPPAQVIDGECERVPE